MTTTAALPVTMEELLAQSENLAAVPQVVMRVIDLTSDPKATATEVERVVGTDPALAARVLALANSSYYGLPRQVSSLHEAVVFLGFKTIRKVATDVTAFSPFLGKGDAHSLARRELWRHAMDTGRIARTITAMLHPADREAFGGDEAFTCGLLHDIGKLTLDACRPEMFVAITDAARTDGLRFSDAEAKTMPWDHAQIGMMLTARWNFPRAICESIGFHHTPRAAMANPCLSATVALANELAHYLSADRQAEKALEAEKARWQALLESAGLMAHVLRLNPERLQAIANACRAEEMPGM